MRWKVHLPLWIIIVILSLLSGCGSLIQEVQKTTGNQINIVDDNPENLEDSEMDEENTGQKGTDDGKEWINPRPYHKVEQIVADPGEGKYSGSLYDEQRVNQALNQMPKGLSEEKLYAYLLGLVGENYTKENDMMKVIANVNHQQITNELQQLWKPAIKVNKGQKPPATGKAQRRVNLVVLMDASNSMSDQLGQKSKWERAKEAVLQLTRSLPPNSTVSVRVYGARSKEKADSCRKSDTLFNIASYQKAKQEAQLNGGMGKIRPMGWSPLARAMDAAYQDFVKAKHKNPQTENILFVVTDNGETCQGDPVAVSQKWRTTKQKIRVHLFGLQVNSRAEKQLQRIAINTLGHFESIRTEQDLQEMIRLNIEDIQRLNDPWQLRMSDHLARNYRSDRSRLTHHYFRMSQKVNREYERLEKATNYLRDKNKINGRDWVRISAFVRDRYQQVDRYGENRLLEIDGKLQQSFTTQSKRLSQAWVKEGKKQTDFDLHQRQRIRLPTHTPKAK